MQENNINNYYDQYDKHYVAIDCIIFGFEGSTLKLLLQKRRFDPLKGEWSLMGGFLGANENFDDAAKRITAELTGLDDVYYEQLEVFGRIDRDSVDRVLSVPFFALIKINEYNNEATNRTGAHWFPVEDFPNLIFDHNEMVTKALEKLRRRCRIRPIGFELLPEKFTIPQLQALYEAILMQTLDKRNFRKKILSMNLLDKLEEKDKESSRKGAWLYNFNHKRYEEFMQEGFNFEI